MPDERNPDAIGHSKLPAQPSSGEARRKSCSIQNGDQSNRSHGSACYCRRGVITHSTTFFDPRIVKLPYHVNENLQRLFDLTIERFISSWFNQLSDDPQFPSEIKLQFQHVCSAVLLRLKTVDVPRLVEEKILCCVVHHVEHLLILNKGTA
nr:unnamed protein product [Spirometra erinaceieuropaei]